MTTKVAYICQGCGAFHKKWLGKCNECNSWGSLVEECQIEGGYINAALSKNKTNNQESKKKLELVSLYSKESIAPRVSVSIDELDRVLGGGLVKGSVVLIGGDPGIGKSTLLLQVANFLSKENVYYISGEESLDQIRLRAKRLGIEKSDIKLASSANILEIIRTIDSANHPNFVVIDSIQTMFLEELSSAPGTVSQVRACGGELIMLAKRKNITLLIVSHVTKDGQIAGPKVLEHMVDTVLYFEGDRGHQFRILRTIKNRYGAANEIGVFEMSDSGLSQVTNPSELFLSTRVSNVSGTVVFAGMEGSRTILVEVQALTAPSYIPSPRRAVIGWDNNRLSMVIAVLSSRFGINLSDKEVYLSIAGGLKIQEPAADLAVTLSLISAIKDKILPENLVVVGEVGLRGEVRMVPDISVRLKEAKKLGFKSCIIPKGVEKLKTWNKLKKSLDDFEINTISHIRELVKFIT